VDFVTAEPTLENYWRAVILFGQNVQSYKFALGKALLDLSTGTNDLVTLEQLAPAFSRHISEHLKHSDKQGTSRTSKFLDACRRFNRSEVSESDLLETTVRLGFVNVIDAFHVVNGADIPTRFFLDERKENGGIRLTDDFYKLIQSDQSGSLPQEAEARWRLVETAWELGVARGLVEVEYDPTEERLTVRPNNRRINVTSCRDSLNGYQKGRCFYCFRGFSTVDGDYDNVDVDHFFPHALKDLGSELYVDGVWNLVLACRECNRGVGGKSAKIPTTELLKRLHSRNEYYIQSHHPLRETVIRQTGNTTEKRIKFLNDSHREAIERLIHQWDPEPKGPASF
jgi:5-methylcytosine-specific restriction endonuclease McrA